jgi:hypothetical protein
MIPPVKMTKERVVVARDRLVGEACSVPHPQFPEEKRGFAKLHAPFLGPQDPGLKARPRPPTSHSSAPFFLFAIFLFLDGPLPQ